KAWWIAKNPSQFTGERWSSSEVGPNSCNDKREFGPQYGLSLVEGRFERGFSFEPGVIHYGFNSGFQAVNLALQFGAQHIVLVGFDMRVVDGREHFFGSHPECQGFGPLSLELFISEFGKAARDLSDDIEIVNATPGSALKCFPS